jgi:hypothetical protein
LKRRHAGDFGSTSLLLSAARVWHSSRPNAQNYQQRPHVSQCSCVGGKNQSFNLGMSMAAKVRTRSFDHAEVMIPIRCNVHAWMIAYAGVLDHPFIP